MNSKKERLDILLKKSGKQKAPTKGIKNDRLKHAGTEENVILVNEVVGLLNHEDQKQTHHSTRLISTKTGLIQCSIVQIIHCDFSLKCLSSSITPVAYYCHFLFAFIFHKVV